MNAIKRSFLLVLGVLTIFGCRVREKNKESTPDSGWVESKQINQPELIASTETQKDNTPVPATGSLDGSLMDVAVLNDEERSSYLTGVWDLFYPTPAGNWGHRFRENGVYRYVDFSREALEERYWYTDGEWRIEGDEIQVKIVSYRISDRDAEEDVLGFRFPPDAKFITVPVDDNSWHSIGTIKSVRIGIVQNGLEYPPRITLRPLRFDRVLDKEFHYYRDRP